MIAFDSFNSIFDKKGTLNIENCWEITESEKQAQLKLLRISFEGGNFRTIENGIYKNMYNSSCKLSSSILDGDCDGIACTIKDEQKYIILTELKSKVDPDTIKHAFEQIIFSFLKLNMLLSVCEGYDINQYEFIGIIACGLKKNQDITKIKDNLMLKQTKDGSLHIKERFFYKVICNNFNKKFNEIKQFRDKGIKTDILNKNLKIKFFSTEPCGEEIDIELNKIIE